MENLELSDTITAKNTEFDWFEVWYAVQFVRDLDQTAPTRFVLLGQPLVIWWDAQTQDWVVFEDRCPHRLAPLSEGRITEDGCLECPYHGWAFTEKGTCDRIPFDQENGTANESPRAQVRTYPTKVAQDILFVYPGTPEKAAQQPLPLVPPLEQHQEQWTKIDVFRDVPYDVVTLLENVLDTSHVSFTHHPRVGKRENAKEFVLEVSEIEQSGFTGFWEEGPRRGQLGSQKTTFVAPNLMWHDIEESPFGQVMTVVYATPIDKGKSRALIRLPFRFKSPFPRFAFKLTPRWYAHLNQMGILEDDQIFLHLQERAIADSPQSYAKTCYLPTRSDRFVLAYRQWVETYGEPFPHQDFPPAETNREILLERYQSHTEHCSSCRTALKRVQGLQKISAILIVFLLIALPITIGYHLPMWGVVLLAGLLLLLTGTTWQLQKLAKGFIQGEYPPSRNINN
ncbi:Rieske 2Fe-2S domain-containing protein [Spirulina sp. CS-785/01]|uniref:aromatic ring-hydroxylating dioxygenase subunit alpha n=1 Tax=Spirulina sp. CS-785/01 TaxID=3021716 RepID=UPI00232B60A4|nr:Rieske 2Fe-2S domain-containing protein [Spirulina sp. CS-785/01]MDB9313754.1 Rieske 2Fe-2S domain-containing protein [Spirulina sp. CS-785/01]